MSTELDEQEVLNIGDDDAPGDESQQDDVNHDDNDRGDDFVDPDAPTSDTDGEGQEAPAGGDKPDGGKDDGPDGEGDREGNTGNIPASRLGEVARAKTAAVAIGKGLVDGTVDKSIIDDLGGYDAVVKAVANRELSLDDLQAATGSKERGDKAPATTETVKDIAQREKEIEDKYIEYHELFDAGEVRESSTLLRQIGKLERELERDVEAGKFAAIEAMKAAQAAEEYTQQIMVEYPILSDRKSTEHNDVVVWANHYQFASGHDRVTALKMAIEKVGLSTPPDSKPDSETEQQKTLRLRKEAELKRSANASLRQPPPMGLGASPKGEVVQDVSKLSEEKFAALTPEEKARARGDFL
jgi:hypothetical protein